MHLGAAQCTSGLYLLYHADDEKVSLYHTENGHSDHTDNPKRGLSQEIGEFIDKKFQEGVQKPNVILQSIRKYEMTEHPKSKLVTCQTQ